MPKFWDDLKRKAGLALLNDEVLQLRREREIAYLNSLPDIPFDPHRPLGVLLSDEIEGYATTYKLIDPFDRDKLKAARYELSVGEMYSIGGKNGLLTDEPGQNAIKIKPFEVVIIQTLERLNLPHFIIARWNIRVKWAYQGLLWVGAAQVDAGYRGYLDCPIYNLSNKEVTLYRGTPIAVIDFVTTTPPTSRSRSFEYRPLNRARILFEDYEPEKLESALARQAHDKIEIFEKKIEELKSTVSNSIGIVLTAIGVLVAVLALFIGGQNTVMSRFSSSDIVSCLALVVAFIALINAKTGKWFGMKIVGWLMCVLLVIFVLYESTASNLQAPTIKQPTAPKVSNP